MGTMTKWAIIKDKTSVEAGYVDHRDDLGGETNHGITRATANEWSSLWAEYGWDGVDMRELPIELAYRIYDDGWWKRMKLDEIWKLSPFLAERIFDFGINAGRANAVVSLQRVLNVSNRKERDYDDLTVDGGMGNKTLNALSMFLERNASNGVEEMTMMMFSMQNYHYVKISEDREANESFTNGWRKRVFRDFVNYAKSFI